jgi:hypothetical protein
MSTPHSIGVTDIFFRSPLNLIDSADLICKISNAIQPDNYLGSTMRMISHKS